MEVRVPLRSTEPDTRLTVPSELTLAEALERPPQLGQKAVYITERAVLHRGPDGLILTEIAPGIDLQRDILDQMGFRPHIAPDLKTMDPRIFLPKAMEYKADLLAKPQLNLPRRLARLAS